MSHNQSLWAFSYSSFKCILLIKHQKWEVWSHSNERINIFNQIVSVIQIEINIKYKYQFK